MAETEGPSAKRTKNEADEAQPLSPTAAAAPPPLAAEKEDGAREAARAVQSITAEANRAAERDGAAGLPSGLKEAEAAAAAAGGPQSGAASGGIAENFFANKRRRAKVRPRRWESRGGESARE